MTRTTPLVIALLLGLVGSVQARHGITGLRAEGTPVAIVGQITSQPRLSLGEKKFQIALGKKRSDNYTLHFSDADLVGMDGEKIAASDLKDKLWVRAEGTIMDDPHRIKVGRLEVIAKDTVSVKKTRYYRADSAQGYIEETKPVKP